MKDTAINIVQLRSTIFLPQNIGYTPENANKFMVATISDGNVYSIVQPGMPTADVVNPSLPQYGMPWRIFKKSEKGDEYNIAFQFGKIDIILAKKTPCDSDVEEKFCVESIKWFSNILDTLEPNTFVTRLAYAPLYAINKNAANSDDFWNKLLGKAFYDETKPQDINLSFLLKRSFNVGNRTLKVNLFHNIFDGMVTKVVNGKPLQGAPVILFQLDLNSVPEQALDLKKEDLTVFFYEILKLKKDLVKNVSQ